MTPPTARMRLWSCVLTLANRSVITAPPPPPPAQVPWALSPPSRMGGLQHAGLAGLDIWGPEGY